MPTYDYKCPSCGRVEEHIHSMNERLLVSCLECYHNGTECKMLPVILSPPVHFKGSGFYETDYKGKR